MVTLEDVSFQYRHGTQPALTGVNLRIEAGEAIGIVGPNGCGKTTLCLTMNGLIPHAVRGSLTGHVGINDKDTRTTPVHALAQHVGIVLQNPESQFFGESVEEELAFGPENLCLPVEEIERRVSESLSLVGLQGLRDRFPYHLSGGQKQRVAIATALAMQPSLLVMDEPTSELDPRGKEEVLEAVGRLHRELGQSVVIVSHETDELVRLVDRVVALSHEGRVVADGSPSEVFRPDIVEPLGLRLPQLFELWAERPEAPPLTVDEAAQRLKGDLREGSIPPGPSLSNDAPKVIECVGLSYEYANGVKALRDVDFSVRRGEFVAIMGSNGSGKTTLTKHLNGLLRPCAGRIVVLGKEPVSVGTAEMAKRVGYAFQNPDHQLFAESVAAEFAFGLRNLGLDPDEIRARSDAALSQAGLRLAPDTYPHFLGKGERQRLALASILAMKPEILVIDEPTTGLDWQNARATLRALDALNREGLTVVFVTHDSRLVAEHAQRVVVMSEGAVVADGAPAAVFHDQDVMRRAAIRPPPIMQLVARLIDHPARFGIRSVGDFQRAWIDR